MATSPRKASPGGGKLYPQCSTKGLPGCAPDKRCLSFTESSFCFNKANKDICEDVFVLSIEEQRGYNLRDFFFYLQPRFPTVSKKKEHFQESLEQIPSHQLATAEPGCHPLTPHHTTARPLVARARVLGSIMEVSGSLQHHHLGDSFSYGWLTQAPAPSFAADAGHAFGSSRSSYIDMDDAELFSMRWTTTTPTSDFDFGLPAPGSAASPAQLVSASQIFRGGRLLPCEPGAAHVDDDSVTLHAADVVVPAPPRWSAPPSPRFHSAQSTPASLSACSSAASNHHAMARPTRRGGSSPWKVLLRYVRFLMPLYRKAKALAPPRHKHNRVAPAAGSPGRGSTSSSVEWCHGSADTAVHDAILYCKKSSGQDALLLP
uniref:Uncharacterized protein n=1 Tax=Avena sativa TaxID=4498 RepID=A0ACD5TTX1_AVESA